MWKYNKISSRLVIVPRHFFTLSKRSKSHHLERAPSRASKSTRFCNMQSSLTRSSFISRQFQSSFCASSKRQSTNKSSSSSSRKSSSSFVTKAGADEDELMQKLMAMIGGGAPVGRPTKGQMVAKENEIKGRDSEMRVTEEHYVLVRVNETSSTSSSSSSSSFGERRQAAYRWRFLNLFSRSFQLVTMVINSRFFIFSSA